MESIKKLLNKKWYIDLDNDYWIPLSLKSYPKLDTVHCDLKDFITNVGLSNLNKIINTMNNHKIFKIEPFVSFEEFDSIDIRITVGADEFYTNETADWVVYITHENTITFGGVEIIKKVKEISRNINWEE